jgi:hypothetical protein
MLKRERGREREREKERERELERRRRKRRVEKRGTILNYMREDLKYSGKFDQVEKFLVLKIKPELNNVVGFFFAIIRA